ncbi:hypothetical protein [Oceanobacillus timonensis]|uniref:hypothetical protein n=1 Tax=Oceanobacillus timonensis TaxID=1926285 RepID=UPI0009BC4471|nr:hypothetical protein [Oceanobacillus timonensis]
MKVGMLRNMDAPPKQARFLTYICNHYNWEFFYFTPRDINRRTINGYFLESGDWIRAETDYPDIIDAPDSIENDARLLDRLSKFSVVVTNSDHRKISNDFRTPDDTFFDVMDAESRLKFYHYVFNKSAPHN